MAWANETHLGANEYKCGWCSYVVSSVKGFYATENNRRRILLCPHCDYPTYIDLEGNQVPGTVPGNEVEHLPESLNDLYKEARNACAVLAYTASVLTSRKLLMNIAVVQGAEEGKSFLHYVEHLANSGYVPPNGRGWVDHIRKKGNEANHEIALMKKEDAEELIAFSEMLMKFIYEFPSKVPVPTT